EVQPDGGPNERAAAVLRARIVGSAVEVMRFELLIGLEEVDLEVAPEVRGAETIAGGRRGARRRRLGNDGAIRFGELEFNRDFDEFGLSAVIFFSLLRAVARGVLAGKTHELCEGRTEFDGGNVRTGLGRRQVQDVLVEVAGRGLVAALPQEIGLADGFRGER